MSEFASNLGFLIGSSQDKSVLDGFRQPRAIDKTGLAGKYTFILEYYDTGTARLARGLPPRVDADTGKALLLAASDPEGGGPNIFGAVQKQLGLRLDAVAAVPLEMIVVDSVDKVPTAN